MRILSLMCILLLGIAKADAQITLSAGDYPSVLIGIDSLKKATYNSPFPPLNSGADMNWDMSSVVDTVPLFFVNRVPNTAHHYSDSSYSHFAGYLYQRKTSFSNLSTGLLEFDQIVDSSKYSLFTLTGSSTDSLFIPAQTNTYTTPRKVIAFPSTNASTWNSQYSSDFHFELSLAGYSLTHAPAIRRTYTEETSVVTGYGKMRVKDVTGSPSSYFKVLQVKTITTTIDSFYLNGSPMSASILGLFMLSQGHKDTIREQNYYRIGEVTPLAKVTFRDDAFLQPYKATTHMQRLISVGVDGVQADNQIRVFPNPATSDFTVDVPGRLIGSSLKISDITGRVVYESTLHHTHNSVKIPVSILPGRYFMIVTTGTGKAYSQTIDISK